MRRAESATSARSLERAVPSPFPWPYRPCVRFTAMDLAGSWPRPHGIMLSHPFLDFASGASRAGRPGPLPPGAGQAEAAPGPCLARRPFRGDPHAAPQRTLQRGLLHRAIAKPAGPGNDDSRGSRRARNARQAIADTSSPADVPGYRVLCGWLDAIGFDVVVGEVAFHAQSMGDAAAGAACATVCIPRRQEERAGS